MLVQAATDLEKCIILLRTPITVQDQPDAKPLIMTNDDVVAGRVGEVRFDNVCFKYQGAERGSSGGLRNISFRIPPGKMLAFVGASGAGKRCVSSFSCLITAFLILGRVRCQSSISVARLRRSDRSAAFSLFALKRLHCVLTSFSSVSFFLFCHET